MAFSYGFSELAQGAQTPTASSDGSSDNAGNTGGATNSGAVAKDINQASVNNEAALLTGGYDPSVANAVSASVGVGVDAEAVEQAAANFALEAERAVSDGRPLDEVRAADTNLSLAAQQVIYEQVAQQNGTTSAEIEQESEAKKAETMAGLQGGMLGALAGMTGQNQVVAAGRNDNSPFAGMLAGMGSFNLGNLTADFGRGTEGFTAGLAQSEGYSKTVAAAAGFDNGRAESRTV